MFRIKIKGLMAVIAVVAVVLGVGLALRARAARFRLTAASYRRAANTLENSLATGKWSPARSRGLVERVHWLNSVGDAFDHAADGPWLPVDPDPNAIACRCDYHAVRPPPPGPPAR